MSGYIIGVYLIALEVKEQMVHEFLFVAVVKVGYEQFQRHLVRAILTVRY